MLIQWRHFYNTYSEVTKGWQYRATATRSQLQQHGHTFTSTGVGRIFFQGGAVGVFPKFFPGGAKSGSICFLPLEIEKTTFLANNFKIQGARPTLPTSMFTRKAITNSCLCEREFLSTLELTIENDDARYIYESTNNPGSTKTKSQVSIAFFSMNVPWYISVWHGRSSMKYQRCKNKKSSILMAWQIWSNFFLVVTPITCSR